MTYRPLTRLVAACALLLIAPAASALAQAGVSYQIPPDNPFADGLGADEVYSSGLRNPFRFSFDRETGDLLIGDVGQGGKEEIDWIGAKAAGGANFGWACREGKDPGPKDGTMECAGVNPVEPLFDYFQPNPRAVTGGVVARDPTLVGLVGRYLYADFYAGDIRSLRLNNVEPDDTSTGLTVMGISSFGEDAAGRVHVTDLIGHRVLRLVAGGTPGTLAAEPLVGSFDGPVAVAGIPGDPSRLLVAEKAGRVRMVVDGAATATAFLDIASSVTSDGERGLLGVAAAPDYASSGKFYVYYTDLDGDIRIDEFQRAADPNIADVSTQRSVIEIPHGSAGNHNGGTVMFGPDGCLWTATGDGGGGNDQFDQAQNLETLLGKLLRIDPDPPALGPACRFPALPPPAENPPGSPPTQSEPTSSVDRSTSASTAGPSMGGSMDVTPPRLAARIPRRQRLLRLRAAIAYARCDEACTVSAGGRVKTAGRRIELPRDTRTSAAADEVRLRLELTPAARRALRRGLKGAVRSYLRMGLRARDAAGNRSRLVRVTVRVWAPPEY